MDNWPNKSSFTTMSQWHAWRLSLDLLEIQDSLPQVDGETGLFTLSQFFNEILTDLITSPQAYGLPNAPYVEYTEPRERLAVDKEKAEWMRIARLKARVAVEVGIFDFLYQLGQAGEPDGEVLRLDRSFYDQLNAEKIKKTKNKAFPNKFERIGFSFSDGNPVVISNTRYPGMLMALSQFARQCATNSEYGFYFFRRCDFGVFGQKSQPGFEDALRLAPEKLRSELRKTDSLLEERKCKREILIADAGAGYRFRYSKKSDQIVYWCRLMSWFSPDFHHNLRWKFESAITPSLFRKLDECKPELADRIFEGIKKCEYEYENCIAKVTIERHGISQECCSEIAWDTIGESLEDFEDLRLVLRLLDELLSMRK